MSANRPPRADYNRLIPREIQRLTGLEAGLEDSSLGQSLLELVRLRVSRINGCGFCVRLHTKVLRLLGESDERIDLVDVWDDVDEFTDRERAALAWAEALTRIADARSVGNDLYDRTVSVFGETALCELTLAVALINTWNRFAIPFHADPRGVDAIVEAKRAALRPRA